jgi:hypothetical protein
VNYIKAWARWLGQLLLRWTDPVVVDTPVPVNAQMLRNVFIAPLHGDAVYEAYLACGLPADRYADTFDLSQTGKLYEILHRASQRVGVDHGIRTVGDIKRILGDAHA